MENSGALWHFNLNAKEERSPLSGFCSNHNRNWLSKEMVIKTLHSFPFLEKEREKKERKSMNITNKGGEKEEENRRKGSYLVTMGEARHLGALTTALWCLNIIYSKSIVNTGKNVIIATK